MDHLQNEANPFIIIFQTKIWTNTVQNIFNHMLGLYKDIAMLCQHNWYEHGMGESSRHSEFHTAYIIRRGLSGLKACRVAPSQRSTSSLLTQGEVYLSPFPLGPSGSAP